MAFFAQFVGLFRIGDRLHRGRIEREQHHLDAVLVHLPQPLLLNVEQPIAQLLHTLSGRKPARILQRVLDSEMFLERNLALHDVLPFRF